MRQLNPIELTENQEAVAARIEQILSPKAAVVARHVARLLASKENGDLFGATEFLIRDAVHRLGAESIDAALEERKKGGTEVAPPSVRGVKKTRNSSDTTKSNS